MCNFRDSITDLQKSGAQIVGISVDGPFANRIFTENRHLNFDLLSDYKRETINKYGVVMRNLGPLEGYDAAKRSIFILDNKGIITYKWLSDDPTIEPNYQEINAALTRTH
jgi:peroxiredoxin